MKPKFTTVIAFAIALTVGMTTFAQTTHVVTLKVDTDKISSGTVDRYANFGQPSGVSNKNYTVFAYRGDNIEWGAIDSSGKRRKVYVEEIKYESGTNLFDKKNFKRERRKRKIKNKIKKGNKDQSEKYIIVFSFKKGGKTYTYQIDPKIVIKI